MDRTVTLDYSKGDDGKAIYLSCTEPDGSGTGYRVAGGKCWGHIRNIQSFQMDEEDLKDLIREARAAIRFLKKRGKT